MNNYAANFDNFNYKDFSPSAPPIGEDEVAARTGKLLTYAYELAQSILTPKNQPKNQPKSQAESFFSQKASVPLIFKYAPWGGINLFGRGDTYLTHNYGKQAEKKDNNVGVRTLVGVIAGIIMGVMAYFSAKTVAKSENLADKAYSFQEMSQNWNQDKEIYDANQILLINCIVYNVDAILERKKTRKVQDLALLLLGITAAGCALAGALMGSSAAMAIGVGAGIVLGAAAIAKYAYQHFSKAEKRNAQFIYNNCLKLNYVPRQ